MPKDTNVTAPSGKVHMLTWVGDTFCGREAHHWPTTDDKADCLMCRRNASSPAALGKMFREYDDSKALEKELIG